MLPAELALLVQDRVPAATALLSTYPGLTRRVMAGEFGVASRAALIVQRAREMALERVL